MSPVRSCVSHDRVDSMLEMGRNPKIGFHKSLVASFLFGLDGEPARKIIPPGEAPARPTKTLAIRSPRLFMSLAKMGGM